MLSIKKFPAYVNGQKNPTKMSFVALQRNDSIEKAVQEYIAKGETKVSLKKVTKIQKNVLSQRLLLKEVLTRMSIDFKTDSML